MKYLKNKYSKAVIIAVLCSIISYFFEEGYHSFGYHIFNFFMMVGIILVIDWASENPQKIDKKEDLE